MFVGICALKSRVVYVLYTAAHIKKWRYWPKNIPGDAIISDFEEKEVGGYMFLPGMCNMFFSVSMR